MSDGKEENHTEKQLKIFRRPDPQPVMSVQKMFINLCNIK